MDETHQLLYISSVRVAKVNDDHSENEDNASLLLMMNPNTSANVIAALFDAYVVIALKWRIKGRHRWMVLLQSIRMFADWW